jgi:hypothetical protein
MKQYKKDTLIAFIILCLNLVYSCKDDLKQENDSKTDSTIVVIEDPEYIEIPDTQTVELLKGILFGEDFSLNNKNLITNIETGKITKHNDRLVFNELVSGDTLGFYINPYILKYKRNFFSTSNGVKTRKIVKNLNTKVVYSDPNKVLDILKYFNSQYYQNELKSFTELNDIINSSHKCDYISKGRKIAIEFGYKSNDKPNKDSKVKVEELGSVKYSFKTNFTRCEIEIDKHCVYEESYSITEIQGEQSYYRDGRIHDDGVSYNVEQDCRVKETFYNVSIIISPNNDIVLEKYGHLLVW